MASPTEIARQAIDEVKELRAKVAQLETELNRYELLSVLNRLAVLETKFSQIEQSAEEIKLIPVLDDRITDLRKSKEEADRRYWQFVVLFVGGILTLAINLVVSFVRK